MSGVLHLQNVTLDIGGEVRSAAFNVSSEETFSPAHPNNQTIRGTWSMILYAHPKFAIGASPRFVGRYVRLGYDA